MQKSLFASTDTSAKVIRGLPFAEYRAIPAVNVSSLCDLLESVRRYRWLQDHDEFDADHYRKGRAVHTATLEPERFLTDYVVWKGGRRQGKEWEAFQAMHTAETILTEDEARQALAIGHAVRDHKTAGRLLSRKGDRELTVLWTHPRTGLRCKSRLDLLLSDTLVDVKTCRSVDKFSSHAAGYLYHVKMAFYADAVAAMRKGRCDVAMIVVETSEPYRVRVRNCPEPYLQFGRERYEKAIDLLIERRRTGDWSDVGENDIEDMSLPVWAQPNDDVDLDFT